MDARKKQKVLNIYIGYDDVETVAYHTQLSSMHQVQLEFLQYAQSTFANFLIGQEMRNNPMTFHLLGSWSLI